jgi:hypothetical protein
LHPHRHCRRHRRIRRRTRHHHGCRPRWSRQNETCCSVGGRTFNDIGGTYGSETSWSLTWTGTTMPTTSKRSS